MKLLFSCSHGHMVTLLTLISLSFVSPIIAQTAANTVRFGHLGDGSASDLDLQAGIRLAFQEAAAASTTTTLSAYGCTFQSIELVSRTVTTMEEAYTQANTLVSQENVVGFLGTSLGPVLTSKVTLNLTSASSPSDFGLSIGPMDSSASLRQASVPHVLHLRASIQNELIALVHYLRSVQSRQLIAIFYESNWISPDLTESYLQQVICGSGPCPLSIQSCPTATGCVVSTKIDSILAQSAPFVPDAVLILASSWLSAAFVSMARMKMPTKTIFAALSDGDIDAIANALFSNVDNLVFSQVVPPLGSTVRTNYLKALGSSTSPTALKFQGYLIGRMAVQLLSRVRVCPVTTSELARSTSCVFSVDDLAFGPFVDGCAQGATNVWIQLGKSLAFSDDPKGKITFSAAIGDNTCQGDVTKLGEKSLIFGQSSPLSGAYQSTGTELRNGILAAFAVANAKGGVQGHTLHLLSLDDQYNATMASINTQSFLSLNVHGLIGYFGTATSYGSSQLAMAKATPFIAPVTGASTLRLSSNPYVLNVRASYFDEVSGLVNYATKRLGIIHFSVFWQNNSFGIEGRLALDEVVSAINLHLLSDVSYTSTLITIDSSINTLITNSAPFTPEAILVFALEDVAASFISAAKQRFPSTTIFLCPSVVGDGFPARMQASGDDSRIYVSQVAPPVTDTTNALVQEYRAAMKSYDSNAKFTMGSFEGYISAKFLISSLKLLETEDLTNRTKLVDTVYSTSVYVLNGLMLGPYSEGCNQGLKEVWMSHVSNGQYEAMPSDAFSFAKYGTCITDPTQLDTKFLIFGQSAAFSGASASTGRMLRDGILSAFNEINKGGGVSGHTLRLISLDDGYQVSNASANTRAFLKTNVHSLLGYYGTSISLSVASIASTSKIPYVAPYTGTASLRTFDPYIVNVRGSYTDEAHALLNYAASIRGITRISMFYQKDSFGESGLQAIANALNGLGLKLMSTGTYDVGSTDIEAGFQSIVSGASPYTPRAVIVWAIGASASKFIQRARAYFPSDVVFLCPSAVGDAFLTTLGSSVSNVYVSQVLPVTNESSNPIVKRYLSAMNVYSSTSTTAFQPSMVSFEAYVNALFTIGVLQRIPTTSIRKREAFVDSIYANQMFVLEGLAIGTYATNSCNQGLKKIWISEVDSQFGYISVPTATFSYPTHCVSVATETLRKPLIFGHVAPSVGSTGYFSALRHREAMSLAFAKYNNESFASSSGKYTLFVAPFSVDVDNTAALATLFKDFDWFLNDHDVLMVTSSIRDPKVQSTLFENTSSRNVLYVAIRGPFSPSTQLAFHSERLYMEGTLTDEMFAIMKYAKNRLKHQTMGLIYEAGVIADGAAVAFQKASEEYTITNFSASLTSSNSISSTISALAQQGSIQSVILAGTRYVPETVRQISVSHPDWVIFLVSSIYDMSEFASLSTSNGLCGTQFIPSASSNTSTLVNNYQNMLNALNSSTTTTSVTASITASHLEGFVAAHFLENLISYVVNDPYDDGNVQRTLYAVGTFAAEGLRIGPYSNKGGDGDGDEDDLVCPTEDCHCDRGMHDVWLVCKSPTISSSSNDHFVEMTEGSFHYDGCGVKLSPKVVPEESKGLGYIIGIIAAGAVVFVIAVVMIAHFSMAKRRKRLHALAAAPKGQVTIVFTDVQDSTHLWDTCAGMRDALETHNDVMREYIEKYKGYEVKTQGDSFMVAFQDANSAVQWSLAVQEALLHCEWPDDILEEKSCAVVKSTSDDTNCEKHPLLFRGLRVRIGMHSGYPDVEYNPRTVGVDYFGPVVNCAARIESLGAGGQVLMSVETHALLTDTTEMVFNYLGRFPLKGMVSEQEVVQVSSKALDNREFPEIKVKTATTNRPGEQACEGCSRLLICPHCKQRNSTSDAQSQSRHKSHASSLFSGISLGIKKDQPLSKGSVRVPSEVNSDGGRASYQRDQRDGGKTSRSRGF